MPKKPLVLMLTMLMLVFLIPFGTLTAAEKTGLRIILDYNSIEDDDTTVMACWFAYAGTLCQIAEKEPLKTDQEVKISFEAELAARTTLAEVWKSLKTEDNSSNKYLDQLEKVYDNNYLPEYVFFYLKRDYWPARSDLKMDEFTAWAKSNLRKHKVLTLAYVAPIDK